MHKRTGCIGHHFALRGSRDFYSNRDDARDIASVLAKSVLDHFESFCTEMIVAQWFCMP